jgi:outer membrane immunogenic protein
MPGIARAQQSPDFMCGEGEKRGSNSMKKDIFAGVSALALFAAASILPASAADIYRPDSAPVAGLKDGPAPVLGWTGFYLGGHAGGSWSTVDFDDSGSKFSSSPEGVIGGGQFGYNLQRGNIVYGVEVDLGYQDLDSKRHRVYIKGDTLSTRGGFQGDATARLGIATGPALLYAKGGVAFLNAETEYDSSKGIDSVRDTLVGWTAGAGVEYMVRPAWSVKVEYQHFDYGNQTLHSLAAVNGEGADIKFSPTSDAVTAGINYHFHREYAPLK